MTTRCPTCDTILEVPKLHDTYQCSHCTTTFIPTEAATATDPKQSPKWLTALIWVSVIGLSGWIIYAMTMETVRLEKRSEENRPLRQPIEFVTVTDANFRYDNGIIHADLTFNNKNGFGVKDIVFEVHYFAQSGTEIASKIETAFIALAPREEQTFHINLGFDPPQTSVRKVLLRSCTRVEAGK